MVEKVSKSLDEKYYEIDHKSGLKIYVMPKENYNSAYAIFGTDYGSIDTKFKRSDKDEWTVVPMSRHWSNKHFSLIVYCSFIFKLRIQSPFYYITNFICRKQLFDIYCYYYYIGV